VLLDSALIPLCVDTQQEAAVFLVIFHASDKAVGAVLSQQIDDNEHVIAYMSKALNKHETSYCTTRKELFAVITALKNCISTNPFTSFL
jgi:hypothetical protein